MEGGVESSNPINLYLLSKRKINYKFYVVRLFSVGQLGRYRMLDDESLTSAKLGNDHEFIIHKIIFSLLRGLLEA